MVIKARERIRTSTKRSRPSQHHAVPGHSVDYTCIIGNIQRTILGLAQVVCPRGMIARNRSNRLPRAYFHETP